MPSLLDVHVFPSDMTACPGSCPLQWTLISVIDERADEHRPYGLKRWPDKQLGMLRQLKSDAERTKTFRSFPVIWSNNEWGFLKLSTIGTYKVWREGNVFQITLAISLKSWLFSCALCVYMMFSSLVLRKPNDFMSLKIYSLLQVTSFHPVHSAASQRLIPYKLPWRCGW